MLQQSESIVREQNARPLVSVIIPNLNGREMLRTCLSSLFQLSFPRDQFEIVVVDNGSVDGSQELAKQLNVRLVSLGRNEGFASAVNFGVREAKGEFVALINNDVEVSSGWLTELLAVLLREGDVVAATGKLLFKDNSELVNDLGGVLLLNGAGFHRGLGTRDICWLKGSYVGAPSGAACLMRRSAFLAVDGLDNAYFAYFEDVDLGWRLWQRGFKIAFCPSAVAHHAWQSTSKRFGARFRAYHCGKNSFANFLKNAQREYLPEAFLLWTLRLFLEVGRYLRSGDGWAILGIAESINWCRLNLKSILTSRKQVQQQRIVSDSGLIRTGILGGFREGVLEARRLHKLNRLLTS